MGENGKASQVVKTRELITPQGAAELRELSRKNRPVSRRTVNIYANIILMGLWDPDTDEIMMDVAGNVIEGAHRLAAIEQAGVPVYCWISRGHSLDTVMNRGTVHPRSPGQNVAIHLGSQGAHADATIAKTVLLLLRYLGRENGKLARVHSITQRDKAIMTVTRGEELKRSVEHVHRFHTWLTAVAPEPPVVLIHLLANAAGKESPALHFVEQIATGQELDVDSPILAVRQKLLRHKTKLSKLPPDDVTALVARAWNGFFLAETLKVVPIPKTFPPLVGMEKERTEEDGEGDG